MNLIAIHLIILVKRHFYTPVSILFRVVSSNMNTQLNCRYLFVLDIEEKLANIFLRVYVTLDTVLNMRTTSYSVTSSDYLIG